MNLEDKMVLLIYSNMVLGILAIPYCRYKKIDLKDKKTANKFIIIWLVAISSITLSICGEVPFYIRLLAVSLGCLVCAIKIGILEALRNTLLHHWNKAN